MIILLIGRSVIGQTIIPSVSNLLRYGDGDRFFGNIRLKQKYFENLTDVRISMLESFVVGFRLLYDDPSEAGETFRGISRRFIEYNNEDL